MLPLNVQGLRGRACWLACSVALIFPAVAYADETPPAADADAATAYRASEFKKTGDEAMDSGRPADALSAYTEAYKLNKQPALLYNKGRALLALTEYPAALEHLEAFEREAPAELRAKVPGLANMLAELRRKITSVTLVCDVEGAYVRVRERTVGRCPFKGPIALNAGPAHFEVTAEGYFPWERDIELAGGGSATFDVHLASKARSGILIVHSNVPAEVSIDGNRVGQTPVEVDVLAGGHALDLSRQGYRPARTSAVIAAGERRDVVVTLEAEPPIWRRWWFWTGVGAVVVGGVTTAIVLSSEKDPTSGSVPPYVVRAGLTSAGFAF